MTDKKEPVVGGRDKEVGKGVFQIEEWCTGLGQDLAQHDQVGERKLIENSQQKQ